ncbi:MAG: LamG domain-containing protein [Gemmatimonadaceae bacterium]|nr:LamG domain-containing protein [Gemmatimonadaceae bacterium]
MTSRVVCWTAACLSAWGCANEPTLVGDPGLPTRAVLAFDGTTPAPLGMARLRIDDPATSAPGPAADIGATDVTIELWVRPTAANARPAVACGANVAWIEGNIILDRDRFNRDRKFGLSLAGGRVVFGVSGNGTGDRTICGTTSITDDRWHHIAVTRRVADGALALWLDGRLEASVASGPAGDISYPDDAVPGSFCNGQPCTNSDPYLVLGGEKHFGAPGYPGFVGRIRALRFSSGVRYTAPFVPGPAFPVDLTTIASWPFTEGSGLLAADAVGGPPFRLEVGGTPAGPRWVTEAN